MRACTPQYYYADSFIVCEQVANFGESLPSHVI
jgi:hypothetical protein